MPQSAPGFDGHHSHVTYPAYPDTPFQPPNGLKQVPINAQITVEFNEPGRQRQSERDHAECGHNAGAGYHSLSTGNQMLIVIPGPGLAANTTYTLTITGVTDLSGNAMTTPVTSTFYTGAAVDFSLPAVTSIVPNQNATAISTHTTIQIQFNKYMNPLSINSTTFTLTTNGVTFVTGIVSSSSDGTSAMLTPSSSANINVIFSDGWKRCYRSRGPISAVVSILFHNGNPMNTVNPSCERRRICPLHRPAMRELHYAEVV